MEELENGIKAQNRQYITSHKLLPITFLTIALFAFITGIWFPAAKELAYTAFLCFGVYHICWLLARALPQGFFFFMIVCAGGYILYVAMNKLTEFLGIDLIYLLLPLIAIGIIFDRANSQTEKCQQCGVYVEKGCCSRCQANKLKL